MTIAELIKRLQELPPQLPVYLLDCDGDPSPLRMDHLRTGYWPGLEWVSSPFGGHWVDSGGDNAPDGLAIGRAAAAPVWETK